MSDISTFLNYFPTDIMQHTKISCKIRWETESTFDKIR